MWENGGLGMGGKGGNGENKEKQGPQTAKQHTLSHNGHTIDSRYGNCAIETKRDICLVGALLNITPPSMSNEQFCPPKIRPKQECSLDTPLDTPFGAHDNNAKRPTHL